MKKYMVTLLAVAALCACNKIEPTYPEGYDKIYYSYFDYLFDDLGTPTLSNQTVTIDRSTGDLSEMGVKFMSQIPRDFDIEVRLYVRNQEWFLKKINVIKKDGMFSTPDSLAVPGLDYAILDDDMNALTPVRTDSVMYYSLVFPKAQQETRKLYIKSLNNIGCTCPRYAWFSLALTHPGYTTEEELKKNAVNHVEDNYQVNTINKSWLRSLVIK